MARIVLFVESLANFPHRRQGPWQLAQQLSRLGHEITVVTSQSENPPVDPKINCLRPFTKWSWFETIAATPRLLQLAPEVLLVVQPDGRSKRSFFHPADILPLFLKVMPNTRLACYLHSAISNNESYSFLELAKNSDHLICSNHSVLDSLREKSLLLGNTMVIPFEDNDAYQSQQSLNDSETEVLESLNSAGKYILLPHGFARIVDPALLLQVVQTLKDRRFVMLAPWHNLPKTQSRQLWGRILETDLQAQFFFVGGQPSLALQRQLFENAEAIALFLYRLQRWECEQFARLAQMAKAKALFLGSQKSLATEFWSSDHNAFFLSDEDPLRSLLSLLEKPFPTPTHEPDYSTQAHLSRDDSANLWNRLLAEDR